MPGKLTKEQIDGMYPGCTMTADELAALIRDSVRRTIEAAGLVVEYSRYEGTDREQVVPVFDLDALINTGHIRNGLIRSERIFRCVGEGIDPVKVNMDLKEKHGIKSYYTLEQIIYGKR